MAYPKGRRRNPDRGDWGIILLDLTALLNEHGSAGGPASRVSRSALARALGASVKTVSKWIKGINRPGVEDQERIATWVRQMRVELRAAPVIRPKPFAQTESSRLDPEPPPRRPVVVRPPPATPPAAAPVQAPAPLPAAAPPVAPARAPRRPRPGRYARQIEQVHRELAPIFGGWRWYITIAAVREWMRLTGRTGELELENPAFAAAQAQLGALSMTARLRDVPPNEYGCLTYRGRTTVAGGKRWGVDCFVQPTVREEGKLPQLVWVATWGRGS